MPPKTPAKTPQETAPETAGVFGYAAEIKARIDKEGEDAVYVRVTRDVEGQAEPEYLHDYPGAAWNLDTMRADFGQGRYTCTIHRRAGHGYVFRRALAVGPAPRSLPAPTPAAATTTPATPAAAPTPGHYDPMSMMVMMVQQAEQRAAASQAQMTAILQSLVTRQQTDPIEQLGKLAPLLQRESTSTEALKLADQLAQRYRGEKREHDDDADDDTSPLTMLGAVLAPIIERFLAKGAAPAAAPNTPQAARRVPNTAQPTPQPAPGAQPVPPTTPPPVTPDSDFPIDDADDDATCPEGYAYTPGQLDEIDAGETRALAMKQHPALGSVCAILKMRFSEGTSDILHVAKEVAAWLNYWGEAAEDQVSAATTHQQWSDADANRQALEALVQEIITNARAAAEGKPAPQLPLIAAVASVHPDFVRDVAIELARMFVQPEQADPAPNPAPAPEPEPTPAPAPTEPAKKRSRRTAK